MLSTRLGGAVLALVSAILNLSVLSPLANAGPSCEDSFMIHAPPLQWKQARSAKALDLSALPGLLVSSLEDPSGSTGATLFRFVNGGALSFDSRGGAVAAVETELIREGSYSNQVDGVFFTGGSTMGLAVADGVRRVLFRERAGRANDFDFIPSVPGAVIYDYGGRVHEGAKPFVYPEAALGEALMSHLEPKFWIGRAGAGSCATCNKIGTPRFGGQGAAIRTFPWGTVFVAVILNPVGDIRVAGQSFSEKFQPARGVESENEPGRNTTLSIVVTDVPLDRNTLKRVGTMVHTSMAESISPFHSETDGDIHFTASLNTDPATRAGRPEVSGFDLALVASDLMKQAIQDAVRTSNGALRHK